MMKRNLILFFIITIALVTIKNTIAGASITRVNFYPTSGIDTSDNGKIYTLNATDLLKLREANESSDYNISHYKSRYRWYLNDSYNDSIYIEFHFSPNIPLDVFIKTIKLHFEWGQYSCDNLDGARLKLWNGSSWKIENISVPPQGKDSFVVLDLTELLRTAEKINSFKLQFQAHDKGGGGPSYHDFVMLEVEYFKCEDLSDEIKCNSYSQYCKWCPLCSDKKVNQWMIGKCVNKTVDCGFSCKLGYCNAECETNCNCANKCEGNIRYFNGNCNENCTCLYNTENCDEYDNWYNTSETQWIDSDQCKEKEQIKQEYRDYFCSPNGCNYEVSNTRWIDTGATRNKPDGTTCDDSLWCTVNDTCQAGVCRGAPRDCSANNMPRIDTCTNDPDNNPFTWDFFAGFISTCDEVNKRCTEGVLNITHTCSKQKCNAECEVNSDCSCPQDYCDGSTYYDYPEHGVCLSNCSCDVRTEGQGAPCKPTIYYNDPRCDRVAPNTTKVVGNPKIEGSGFTWISQRTKITLTCVDNFPNVTLYWAYQVDNGDWNKFSKTCENNNTCIVEFNFTEDSNHTLQYYCVDAAGNSEKVHEQKYRVDSEAPESNKTYGTPFYSSCGKDYINSSTRIRLSALDKGCSEGVGVDKILYRIDNGSWQEYCCEFTIQQEGEHRICFKAIDKLGNEEQEKCQNVTVDNTPPTTTKTIGEPKCSAQTCGINCETINSSTPITLSASDSSSGLNKTYYRYCSGNESCSGVWNVYTTSFNIVGIPDGYVRIEYYSVDNLGNKEETKYQIHYLDNTPPSTRIITPFNVTKTVTNFTINIEDRDHCIAKCYYQVCNSSWCSDWLERNCNSPITLNLCDYIDSCNLCNNTKVNITLKAYSEDCIGYRSNITSATYTVELIAYQDGYPFINVYPTTLIPTFVNKWYYFFLPRRVLVDAGFTNFTIPYVLSSIQGQYEAVFHYNGTSWLSYDPSRPDFLNTLKEFSDNGDWPYYIKMK